MVTHTDTILKINCLFRCLALHFGESIRTLEGTAKHFKKKLVEYTGKRFDDGVAVNMLSTVETCFKVGINVYALQVDKTAKSLRISSLDYKQDDIMHLNLYEEHFSYIKKDKFKSYAKKFTCPNCTRILAKSCNLLPHVEKCQSEVEEVFKGGKYRVKDCL